MAALYMVAAQKLSYIKTYGDDAARLLRAPWKTATMP
jgi:hypothetical protein